MNAKDLRQLVKNLKAQGWRVEETKKGYMAYPPDQTLSPVSFHKTPSDHRAAANLLSALRQRGYDG